MSISARVILKDEEGRTIMQESIYHKNEEQLKPYMQEIIARKFVPQMKCGYKISISELQKG